MFKFSQLLQKSYVIAVNVDNNTQGTSPLYLESTHGIFLQKNKAGMS